MSEIPHVRWKRLETLYFDVLQLVYHLSLALIIGGAIVLGSAVAPAVFKAARTRGEGGLLFGAIVGRYDQLALFGIFGLVVTTILRFFAFEDTDIGWRLIARWTALAVVALAVLYGSAWSDPVARTQRAQTRDFDELPETAPARVEFAKLHRSSKRAMQLVIVAGLAAMFLS